MKTGRQRVRMDFDQNMGALDPFSLRRRGRRHHWPSWLYHRDGARQPHGRAVVPFEMLSVLSSRFCLVDDGFPVWGPAVGLFADQEIRLVEGPLFVAEDDELERDIVAISASRRTESLWVRTSVMRPGTDRVVAVMLLLISRSLKDSDAPDAAQHAALTDMRTLATRVIKDRPVSERRQTGLQADEIGLSSTLNRRQSSVASDPRLAASDRGSGKLRMGRLRRLAVGAWRVAARLGTARGGAPRPRSS